MLVLDDYHVIGSPQVHESLAFLVEHRPAGIVRGTGQPQRPAAAAGAAAGTRPADRDTRRPSCGSRPRRPAELLQHAASALPDASVAALAARTEGWAAGLQLAALSLRGQADAAAFVAAFTGSHRYVLDYLAEEVLERQDKQLRMFLLETSVLERLSAARCATPSPAARAARRCWRRRSGRACSWSRWMRCAAGGAITTCSPTCSAPACRKSSPAGRPSCTATPRPGTPGTGWPTTPSGTRSPPGRCSGRPGSSSSTSIWSTASAARRRPSTGGCRCSPLRWSGPAPGCCWRRPSWPPPAATSRSWNRSWTRLSARLPAGPMSRSSQPAAWRPAT